MFVLNQHLFISLLPRKGNNKAMDKNTQKRTKHNALAVNKVAEKYGFTPRYVRMCLKGDHKGPMPDNIIKDYKRLCREFEKVTENIINQ